MDNMVTAQYDFCVKLYQRFSIPYDSESRFFHYAIPGWIFGILVNLVNVAVFRHRNMTHPINSIFLWLSISDLLELVSLASNQWFCNWCGGIQIINPYWHQENINDCLLILVSQYLFQVFHTITIGLNIVLAFCQYRVVAHPLMNLQNPFTDQFIKSAIIWTYILSFVLYLPLLKVQKIRPSRDSEGNFGWKIELNRNQDGEIWPMNPLLYTYVLICGVSRVGLLILLIIFCALLLSAIRNAHSERKGLGMSDSQLSEAQKNVNRINVTITIVIIMFLITEIPLGISTLLILKEDLIPCSYAINSVLLPVLLLNCCYSIFCYLIRIKRYREILKLLFRIRG